MANRKSHRRRNKPVNNMIWIVMGLIGGAVLVIAAIALLARGNNNGGDKTFDPNFQPTVTGAPAVAVLPNDVIDYGDVKLGATVNTVFKVRNMGDQPLVVLGEPQVELVQGCWPPRAVVSSTTIEPGHEATVSLSFMMHAGMDGQHEFRVHLRTNDPTEPDKQLTILSNWVP